PSMMSRCSHSAPERLTRSVSFSNRRKFAASNEGAMFIAIRYGAGLVLSMEELLSGPKPRQARVRQGRPAASVVQASLEPPAAVYRRALREAARPAGSGGGGREHPCARSDCA